MTHDSVADAAFIYVADPIRPGGVAQTRMLHHYTPDASVHVHFDADNRLLGIEFLGFSRLVPDEVSQRVMGTDE